MYSIIEQGGLQFRVEPGATIIVPLIAADAGSEVAIDKVLRRRHRAGEHQASGIDRVPFSVPLRRDWRRTTPQP